MNTQRIDAQQAAAPRAAEENTQSIQLDDSNRFSSSEFVIANRILAKPLSDIYFDPQTGDRREGTIPGIGTYKFERVPGKGALVEVKGANGDTFVFELDLKGQITKGSSSEGANIANLEQPPVSIPELDNANRLDKDGLDIVSNALQGTVTQLVRDAAPGSTTTGTIDGVGTYVLHKDENGNGTIEIDLFDGGSVTLKTDAGAQITAGSANGDFSSLIPIPELDNANRLDKDGLDIVSNALQGTVTQLVRDAAPGSTTTGTIDGVGTYVLHKDENGNGTIEIDLFDGGSVTLKTDAGAQITAGSANGDFSSLIPIPELDNANRLDKNGIDIVSNALQGTVTQLVRDAAPGSTTTGTIDGVGTYVLHKDENGNGTIEIDLFDGGSVTLKTDAGGQITAGSADGDFKSLVPDQGVYNAVLNFLQQNNYDAEGVDRVIEWIEGLDLEAGYKQSILFALNEYRNSL